MMMNTLEKEDGMEGREAYKRCKMIIRLRKHKTTLVLNMHFGHLKTAELAHLLF